MRTRQGGIALIELIMATVVIGIVIAGALGWISSTSMRSARAMARSQAAAIADAYLRNVLAKTYSQVRGYPANTYDTGAYDANGAPIAGLERYNVRINRAQVTMGTAPNAMTAQRVIIIVTDPTGGTTRITGFRTNYTGQVVY